MKPLALSLSTLLALAVPAAALACNGEQHAKAEVKKVTVPELAKLNETKQAKAVDANSAETRSQFGIIPGAVLLTSAMDFDPAKELPAEKNQKLVFYCANTRCTASHKAAQKAIEAGYTEVSILPEGIKGWKAAGQRTDMPRS
jgi:rhodanese-related sulfurtransferase